MPQIRIVLDVERQGFSAMLDLARRHPGKTTEQLIAAGDLIHLGNDGRVEIGALTAGTAAGNPSTAFCFPLPDGRVVLAEVTMKLLLTGIDTLVTLYGDPR